MGQKALLFSTPAIWKKPVKETEIKEVFDSVEFKTVVKSMVMTLLVIATVIAKYIDIDFA